MLIIVKLSKETITIEYNRDKPNMPNYNNGKIYSIRSHQTDQIYIGSTTQPLCKRLYGHRQKYKLYKNTGNCGRSYMTSFEILQYDDHYIELIEECPCDTRQQLCRREGQIIRASECVNKHIAGRTKKQYQQDNKDKICEYKKQYYQDNKDELLVKNKQYREGNKEKINAKKKQYYEDNKDELLVKKKQYYENNKDKIIAKIKQYRENNKDKLLAKRKEKIVCECGSIVGRCCLTRHKKSKKHLRWDSKKEENKK